ncbi:MAG: ATP-binding cassette domain-containing protein [Erysipelotrichaceae bacterium]|nr:ATP-binding cassette domain-containing protein [Erysipelotrichaceae bacterium]
MKNIKVINAREHNLKDVTVEFPYYKLNVVTGCSGSGKSSLVYDTIFAESQRQLYENFIDNTFGLKIMKKPDVDAIERLCPAISVAQNSYNFNPNSTVGTYTDLSEELRTLFAFIINREEGTSFKPRDFSNGQSRYLCKKCGGTGKVWKLSTEKIIPDPTLTLREGGIIYFKGTQKSYEMQRLTMICERHGIDMDTRICDLTSNQYNLLVNDGDGEKYTVKFERGSKKNCQKTGVFNGVMNELGEDYKRIKTPMIFQQLSRYLDEYTCDACEGFKLDVEILSHKICGYNISEVENLEMRELINWCNEVQKKYQEINSRGMVASLNHILKTAASMDSLNLDYLSLSRVIPSLSGGEFQRLRLAKQLCGSMSEVLYILDEPCKGLHFLDVAGIASISQQLVDKGNTVIAIEHNAQYISIADNVVYMGPGSGPDGGEIVFSQSMPKVTVFSNHTERHPSEMMQFEGITANNIQNQSCKVPVGAITFITGVSGSGKSTLAEEVIFRSLTRKEPINCKHISIPKTYKVFFVNQQPIGKTSRSSVVSYLKISDEIRRLFANTAPKAKKIKPSHFSTNCPGGRCDKCDGSGIISLNSNVMPDAYVVCDECNGKRFKQEILDIQYKGKSIYDVLEMTISDALGLFSDNKKISAMLQCMIDIGIGYLKLGQLSMNLSGGEAQRIKLAKVLGEESQKNSILILDEPTSGLGESDIQKIGNVIEQLADQGNTIIIIDHNLDFIMANADYCVDFGTQGGKMGGQIVDQGFFQEISSRKKASLFALTR